MFSTTNNAARNTSPAPAFSLMAIVSFLFQLDLRDKLAAETGGDKSDGAYTWGL